MAARTAWLAIASTWPWTTASANNIFESFGQQLLYGTGGAGCRPSITCLTAPRPDFPVVTVRGCIHAPEDSWHLPKNGQPGPIRNGAKDWLCLTATKSLLEREPWPHAPEIRTVSLEPCNGSASQDFIMPEREWAQGCIGEIRWASDRNYQLTSRAGEAVLSKMIAQHDALWDVHFWERSWILSASAQLMVLHSLVILGLVLLQIQAFRFLRMVGLYVKRFLVARWNGSVRIGICTVITVAARRLARRAQQLFRWLIGQDKNDLVYNLYNSNRIARVQRAIWVMQPLLSAVLVGNIRSRPREMIWSFFDPPEVRNPHDISRALASAGLLPAVVLLAWATLFSVCPQLMSARALDCSNVVLTASWALHDAVVQSKARASSHNDTLDWIRMLQVLSASLLGNAVLATPLQVLLAATHVHRHMRSNSSGGTYVTNSETVTEVGYLLMFLAFIWLIDLQTWSQAIATANAKQADSGRVMVSRLLDSMCDAVVLVDESMCIGSAGSPQLAALLMHQGSSAMSPLKGVSLTELVVDDDRERFQDFMMREHAAAKVGFGVQAPVASSLQIFMHDALHIAVPVELFCSCSLGAESGGSGPLQYLLGIRESEGNRMLPEAPQPLPLQLHGMRHTAVPERTRDHGSSQESPANLLQLGPISEMHQASSDGCGSSESSVSLLGVRVWIDLGTEDLTCVHWTPSFAVIFQNPPQGAAFLQWTLEPERQDLLAWLRQSHAAGHSQTPLNIILKIPGRSDERRRAGREKRRFICTLAEDAQVPVSKPSCPGTTIVRLDLVELKERSRFRQSNRARNQASRKTIWLWVNVESKTILKSKNAPGNLLKKGSRLVVCETADQEGPGLFRRIDEALFALAMIEHSEPASFSVGTYTLASGGFELSAEVSLMDWGEAWNGKDEDWWLLSLVNIRLLGAAEPHGRESI